MNVSLVRKALAAAFLAACAAVAPSPAGAQDFYAGKVVTLIVGYEAGSLYDMNARFMARHLGAQIPGNPKIIVQNMPGAGTLTAANHVANNAAKDGTMLVLVARGMALEPLFGGAGVRFDPLKLNWIGSTSREVSVIAVRADSGVKTIEDAMKKEVVVAGPAPGTDGVTYPTTLNNLIGTKFKIVTGYRSGKEMAMAVQRNEVQGRGSWSYASFQMEALELVKKGEMNILLQMAMTRSPEIPDVPSAMEYAKTDEHRQILELILAGQAMAWPMFVAPEVPAERVEILRKAWLAMLKEPDALADAKKVGVEIEPVPGAEIDALLRRLYATPPEIVKKVRELAGRG